jgi:DNA-binding transcriptional ArsR family regulator
MSLTNPFGDLPVTDPQAMRALAHPVRLAILSYLQREGPATATMLAPHVNATPSVVSWHLRHLAGFGLVEDADPPSGDRRQRWWKSLARGFSFELSDDPAAEMLADQLSATAQEQVREWTNSIRDSLPPEWLRLSGLSNTRVKVTTDELEAIADGINELLAPYALRESAPDGARHVRVLRQYLPYGEDDS